MISKRVRAKIKAAGLIVENNIAKAPFMGYNRGHHTLDPATHDHEFTHGHEKECNQSGIHTVNKNPKIV
jgi:hypothetical protein